jgi:hypothetical protein
VLHKWRLKQEDKKNNFLHRYICTEITKYMKKKILLSLITMIVSLVTFAQCSICSKTASQMGEGPAKALNGAIVYLMIMPFAIIGFIAYRWFKNERKAG